MELASKVLIAVVALLHVWFLVLEMFLWDKPLGLKTFGKDLAFAQSTKVLAANQGLYNGFLAAGLAWSLWLGATGAGRSVAMFFLGCVIVAGVYGALSVSRKILFVQAVPAVAAMLALMLA